MEGVGCKRRYLQSYSHVQTMVSWGSTCTESSSLCPTLPKAPWQMSVRVAPPAMNWGLEHSSWEQNKPGITHSRGQGREQGPTCSKLTKPLTTAGEHHRDGAGQERMRAPDTPSTLRTELVTKACVQPSHSTGRARRCAALSHACTHCSAITSPPLSYTKVFA